MTLNYRNMKKILYIAAAAALLMASCQKTDVLNVVEDTIDFGTEVGKLTKAGDTQEGEGGSTTSSYDASKFTTLKNQGFRVWVVSDFTSGIHTDGAIYNNMNGLDIEYNSGWVYKNSGKYMWPQADQYLLFYTISSNDVAWLDGIKTKSLFNTVKDAAHVTEITFDQYTVKGVADDDIMVANHIRQSKSPSMVVSPTFRHTMTKVEFNFVKGTPSANGADVASTVILKGIETSELFSTGELNIKYGDSEVTFDWKNPGTAVSYLKNGSDVVTIAKKGGKVVEVLDAVPSGDAATAAPAVVYTKDTEGKVTSVAIYETEEVVVDNVTSYKWKETVSETHTLTNAGWNGANKYETLNGFVLRTKEDIQKEVANANYDNFATWYMIPQTLAKAELGEDGNDEDLMRDTSGAVVTIHYIADGKHLSQNFNLNVGSNTSEDQDWNEEHCVRYNVTIAPHKIDFKPTVGQWEPNTTPGLNN